jgi:hypothetical protein
MEIPGKLPVPGKELPGRWMEGIPPRPGVRKTTGESTNKIISSYNFVFV